MRGDPDPERIPLFHGSLGRSVGWVCLIAPLVTAPVLQRDLFELDPATLALAIAGNAVPGWGVPLAVYAAYRFVLRPVLARTRSTAGRAAAHFVVSTLAAVGASLIVRPAMVLFSNQEPSALGFAASCAVMTWAFVLPFAVIEHLADRREAAERRTWSLREAALQAELDALRARIHPHFLFNAMNTIAGLVHDDPALAEVTVERLGSVLRYVLVSSTHESVPLEQEIALWSEYLEVQRARFGDRLRFTIDADPGLEEVELPPLLLLPLVENAVIHGVTPAEEGGRVDIAVRSIGDRLELTVANTGRARRSGGSGTSLRDLRRRLDLLYGDAARLVTTDGPDGFVARLELPR